MSVNLTSHVLPNNIKGRSPERSLDGDVVRCLDALGLGLEVFKGLGELAGTEDVGLRGEGRGGEEGESD